MFLVIIIIIFVSVSLAYRSLRNHRQDGEINEVREELKKGKIIFHDDSLSLESSE